MAEISTDTRVRGLTFRRKKDNKTLTAFGVHKDGLKELLVMFGISPELQTQVLSEAQTSWANLLIIERATEHPKGFSHFCVKSINHEPADES